MAEKSVKQPVLRNRRRKEARPGELVDAGLRCFAEKGFAGTKLDDVAVRAGVVKGTIYRYFDSKEDLFRAAVRAKLLPTLDGFEVMLAKVEAQSEMSAEALLRMIIAQIYERIVKSDAREILRIIIAECRQFPDLPAFYQAEVLSKGEALIGRVLELGIQRGEFADNAATRLPVAVIGPAIVAAIWQMVFQEHRPISADRFLAAHLDLVLNGILKDGHEC